MNESDNQVRDFCAQLNAELASMRASRDALAEAVKRLMVCMALAGWENDPAAEFARLALAQHAKGKAS
jgi:hypothetical protein